MRGEDTDNTRSHRLPGAKPWVWSSLNWSVFWEDPDTPREDSGSLFMQPIDCTQWRSTDAVHDVVR